MLYLIEADEVEATVITSFPQSWKCLSNVLYFQEEENVGMHFVLVQYSEKYLANISLV